MNSIQEQKKALRQTILKLKNEHDQQERLMQSKAIFKQIEQLAKFNNAQVVMLYWSMNDEVNTHAFIEKWYRHKTILLPAVDGDILRIKKYEGDQSMRTGEQFGILEPTGSDFTTINQIDIIIVPGVAFDQSNNRMGRGRGYYDKLLEHTKAYKIGVCFNYQMVPHVPVEKHDFKMDGVFWA